MKYTYVCPCLLGLEGLVADELKYVMNAEDVEAENGRVLFSGDLNLMARANIGSRYAERVLVLLGTFKATTFDELFEGVKSLELSQWIGKNDAFPVKGHSLKSKLTSIPDCQSIIKKAIVENLKQKYNVSWFEESGPVHQIQFLIMKDTVSIMLDTSGEGLHKRGYRENSIAAPIRETLAAAMIKLAHIRCNSNLIDPCCGSGTILIEGATYAMNMAPGLKRKFIAETWDNIDNSIFQEERNKALCKIRRDLDFFAYGYDTDDQALALTLENAKKAGVASRIKTQNRDIKDFQSDFYRTSVICNPPYGERLLDLDAARELYKTMGNLFTRKEGFSYYIISPDEKFEEYFGRVADKRRKLYNGMIKCQFYMYFK